MDRELWGMHNVYVLHNTDTSGSSLLDLANGYYELSQTVYAHPIFGVRMKLMGYNLYDFYHDVQFHLKMVIGEFNQASVWDFAGLTRPVTVAVIDDGITEHEDLPTDRILPGYDFMGDYYGDTPDDDPAPGTLVAHGMGCAGIIAASHSTIPSAHGQSWSGMISLCPNALVLPVKNFTDDGWGGTADVGAEIVSYAWQSGAEVLSNSWGFGCPECDWPVLDDAIERAYAFGRNGKGCPVVFASGNGAEHFPGKVDEVLSRVVDWLFERFLLVSV